MSSTYLKLGYIHIAGLLNKPDSKRQWVRRETQISFPLSYYLTVVIWCDLLIYTHKTIIPFSCL